MKTKPKILFNVRKQHKGHKKQQRNVPFYRLTSNVLMQDALDYDCELIRASTVSPKTNDDDDKDDESLREKRSVKRIPTSVGGVVVWSQWLGGGSPPA